MTKGQNSPKKGEQFDQYATMANSAFLPSLIKAH